MSTMITVSLLADIQGANLTLHAKSLSPAHRSHAESIISGHEPDIAGLYPGNFDCRAHELP